MSEQEFFDEDEELDEFESPLPEDEEEELDAVTQNRLKKFYPQNQQHRGQQNCQNVRPQNNYRNNQGQQQWKNNNPGNNSNRNKMTCIFCRKQGHQQEDCR